MAITYLIEEKLKKPYLPNKVIILARATLALEGLQDLSWIRLTLVRLHDLTSDVLNKSYGISEMTIQ